MYRRRKNIAAPKITMIRTIHTMRGMTPPERNPTMLHPKSWFHILTHARAWWWSLHIRGAVLFRRGIRTHDRVEMGPGEYCRHDHHQSALPGIFHLNPARPVLPVPRDVVGAS